MGAGQDSGGTYDVAVVGGGPAGATVAALLRRYGPDLRVLVLEREVFPRPHIGESHLPSISAILHEMGAWDKVEAAGFPIKLGASLTWGRRNESWDFDFYPVEQFRDEPRPARYEGQRRFTAFQVDRALYDKILLDHARELGATVREGTGVREVITDGDRVAGLRLADGQLVTARWYVDATGVVGLFRRVLGIGADIPEQLKNIALWDYWDNVEWAVTIGVGGTRIQIRSLPYGWLWFIPISPTRASVGFVCPATYYRQRGLSPAALYHTAIADHPQIRHLLRQATARGEVEATRDWSNVADRIAGENWFLVGEAAGFADPILSAGLSLAHASARDAAYTILELDRGEHDPAWLRQRFDDKNRTNIRQHMRFALYWYAANGCFTDLQEHCRKIARDAGLKLSPADAWRWLAQGGFTTETLGKAHLGSFDIAAARRLVGQLQHTDLGYAVQKFNVFRPNTLGATRTSVGELRNGRIHRVPCLQRGVYLLPLIGCYDNVLRALEQTRDGVTLMGLLQRSIAMQVRPEDQPAAMSDHIQALEAMVQEGWVTARRDPRRPTIRLSQSGGGLIRSSAEGEQALQRRQRSP